MMGIVQGTLVEAVDGPAPIEELAGKGMPVLTLLPSGARGFRIISKIEPSGATVPVVRLALENGHAVELAAGQELYRADATVVRAADLVPGDRLLPSFHYPPGYHLAGAARGADDGAGQAAGITVLSVEPRGEKVVYQGRVKETGCMFLNAGILCRV